MQKVGLKAKKGSEEVLLFGGKEGRPGQMTEAGHRTVMIVLACEMRDGSST
jgi:hypothetical protein